MLAGFDVSILYLWDAAAKNRHFYKIEPLKTGICGPKANKMKCDGCHSCYFFIVYIT